MNWMDEYNKALQRHRKVEQTVAKTTGNVTPRGGFTGSAVAPVNNKPRTRITVTAPVKSTKKKKEENKWYDGWLQKGAFEDGFNLLNTTKAILGTSADLAQDVTQGALGIVEKGIDFLTVNAGNIAKGMYYQNGGGYNVELDRMFEESLKASQPMMENFAKKDIINEEKISRAIVSGDYEKQSVLGAKADQTVQSGGQLLAAAGLQAVGIPWWMTTGATAWGAEAENALNQGATMEEANLSGAISAGAEILTEKISGGIKFGGKALDDAATDYLSRAISNKFARNALKFGLDATGEGFEEILSQDISSFGQWLTYRDEEELKELLGSEEAMDEKIQAFIGGALMGGVSNVGNAIKSSRQGVDSVSGLTQNEEAVVRKVYDDLVAEAQKDGKVSAKEKTKIYDSVIEKLEKGYIDTDTIESLMDEEGYNAYKAEKDKFNDTIYKSYKDNLSNEATEIKKLKEQLKFLEDAPGTAGNIKKLEAVQNRIEQLQNNPESAKFKPQLDEEVKRINQIHNDLRTKVRDMVKGTKLEESYNELIRKNQKFEADTSEYKNEYSKKTVQNIVDSGLADNTNEFHENVDWLAKISEGRDVTFTLTNNEQLKKSGQYVKGAKTNAFINENGDITLNIDSSEGIKAAAGHEVFHTVEGTKHYDAYQKHLFDFAIEKEGLEAFNERLETYKELYKDRKNTTPEKELAAQLMGEYGFTEQDFVDRLLVKDKNLFQVVWDEVKYLYRLATAGSKAQRELEQAMHIFEKAWNEGKTKNTADGGVKFSLYSRPDFNAEEWTIVNRRKHSEFDNPKYDLDTDRKWMYANEKGSTVFAIYSKSDADDPTILYGSHGKNAIKDYEKLAAHLSGGRNAKRGRGTLDRLLASIERNEGNRSNGFTNAERTFTASEDVSIPFEESGSNRQGDFRDGTENLQAALTDPNSKTSEESGASITFSNDYATIRNYMKDGDTNEKYSLSENEDLDIDDLELLLDDEDIDWDEILGTKWVSNISETEIAPTKAETTEAKEWLPTSKEEIKQMYKDAIDSGDISKAQRIVDEVARLAGYTQKGYHGTSEQFNTFSEDKISAANVWGRGFYFGTTKSIADDYAYSAGKDGGGERVISAYLKMENPFIPRESSLGTAQEIKDKWFPDMWNDFPELGLGYIEGKLQNDPHDLLQFIAAKNGLEIRDVLSYYGYDSVKSHGELVVFSPEQIKSSDPVTFDDDMNWIPVNERFNTENPDIRYSADNGKPKQYHNGDVPLNKFKYNPYQDLAPVAPNRNLGKINTDDYLKGRIPTGKLVKAADRKNFGYVYDYDEGTGLYSVRFTSDKGTSKIVEFEAKDLDMIDTRAEMYHTDPDVDHYEYENAVSVIEATEARMAELAEMDLMNPELAQEYDSMFEAWVEAKTVEAEIGAQFSEQAESITDADAPPVKPRMDAPVKKQAKTSNAKVLKKTPKKSKSGIWQSFATSWIDKGSAVEKLSLDTGNMELQAKWNSALPANTDAKAQYFMENGQGKVPSLKNVLKEQNKSGKTDLFNEYMYHLRNIDSMTLQDRFGVANKPVYGKNVTADISRKKVANWEKQNPEFKRWAQDYYKITNFMLDQLVKENLLTVEAAERFREMYPHYVPIKRDKANTRSYQNDKLSVGNTIKKATGGNEDILPLANTMAERIQQHFSAIARNQFGLELKNTLDSVATSTKNGNTGEDILEIFDDFEQGLLKQGNNNTMPTYTVFEDGKRVEFEISGDLYDALKPAGKTALREPVLSTLNETRRKLLTVWNPVFSLYRNPAKDLQDVLVNSQHPARTYANIPNAFIQLAFGGEMATEYKKNGGKSNTYYDSNKNRFNFEDNVFKKVFGVPFRAIEQAGEFIEQVPRLADYIVSRKDGRSVERSMLDAARVTTNFAAGGDYTKFVNRHGATFLNASVQGAAQNVRNFRESAKLEGAMGVVKTLTKYVLAGAPALLFNALVWGDDEEYEELNDYVKENYYVLFKNPTTGKFFRIPKGRTAAVVSNAMEQMGHLLTGDGEADLGMFWDLFIENIAPNNPLTDNMFAPLFQAASNNAWYNADIVPERLQDLPKAEQFDESTDSISMWLSEKLPVSPMKVNYLLDQYSGGIGDVVLPMLTPEVESGDDSLVGNLLAPWKKEMTTDSVLNNKNPGMFFDLSDEIEIAANSSKATEEDKAKARYMQSVGYEISDLYAQKRETQISDIPADKKYETIRKLQEQINELAKDALENYDDVFVKGLYSEVGERRYEMDANTGKWYEIEPTKADGSDNWYYQKEQEVTKALGISYEKYWNNREEYNFAYDKPEQYALSKAVGGYDSYQKYTSDIYDLKADKDEYGETISGSKKKKVYDYINNLDIPYGEKVILYRSMYDSKADKQAYNAEILEYLNGRKDISYEDKVSILKYLDFNVDSNGRVTW